MKYQRILAYNILLIIYVNVFHMQMEPLESAGLLSSVKPIQVVNSI